MDQTFSHYPAWPVPVSVRLSVLDEHACSYLPGRMAQMRGFWAESASPEALEALLDAGFRRSGKILYQPICRGCRACVPIRIDVGAFSPTKSQHRVLSKNRDITLSMGVPVLTSEKFALYQRYLEGQHERSEGSSVDDLESFLYSGPIESTIEIEYRSSDGSLIGVGICDVLGQVVSSVYFYWAPEEKWRSMGVFGFLKEMEISRILGKSWYHFGYWVEGSVTMNYKAGFAKTEVLSSDGLWRGMERRKLEK